MKLTKILALALLALVGCASIAGAVSPPIVQSPNTYADPCSAPIVAQLSVPLAITSATTAALVAGKTGYTIYVCGYAFLESGTATAGVLFENANGTACASTTAVTGTMGAASMASPVFLKTGVDSALAETQFQSTGIGGLCVVSSGALVNVGGYLKYVQLKNQP